ECEGMGQISMKISALPGSVLSENQQADVLPWHSTTATAGARCTVAGIRPSDGMVVFSYPGT
ncbi:hypothetical protein, partial [Acetobacter fabarum]|uniref:hypothetical protein n=1 Tax=Acetobacter fabarum TaxID=483199 RepID=UPI0033AF5DCF